MNEVLYEKLVRLFVKRPEILDEIRERLESDEIVD